MIEKSMIMSAREVRALLDGSKTMTRRLVKFPNWIERGNAINIPTPIASAVAVEEFSNGWFFTCDNEGGGAKIGCPHPVGSKIYAKETFYDSSRESKRHPVTYRADTSIDEDLSRDFAWKPSIFMPKKFARIWLEVTAVKVERLGDISEDDAKKEGIFHTDYGMWCFHRNEIYDPNKCKAPRQHHNQLEGWHWDKTISYTQCLGSPVSAYVNLWTSLHGPGSWERDKDKWCWCYSFRKL